MRRYPALRLPAVAALALLFLAGPSATAGSDQPVATGGLVPGRISVERAARDARREVVLATVPGDAVLVRLDGTITPEVAERFHDTLDAVPPGQPILLELSSPGGYTSAGYAMIDRILAERARGRAVATRVRGGESCESMCVGLFMAGQPRFAAPNSIFMVHAPRGLRSGTVTVRSTGRMIERLIGLGASAAWIEQVKAAGGFSGQVDYRTNAADLTAARAGVVTDLTP